MTFEKARERRIFNDGEITDHGCFSITSAEAL